MVNGAWLHAVCRDVSPAVVCGRVSTSASATSAAASSLAGSSHVTVYLETARSVLTDVMSNWLAALAADEWRCERRGQGLTRKTSTKPV
jgi:hypothetical protein